MAAFLEHRRWLLAGAWQGPAVTPRLAWVVGGVLALGAYGLAATRQPSGDFGRVLAAYGGDLHRRIPALVAGCADGYRPDRYDVIGALICLVGMAVIIYSPRGR